MGSSWDDPKWVRQGRTGPNGPKYSKASDRRKVRQQAHAKDGSGCRKAATVIVLVVGSAVTGIGWGLTELVRAVTS